MAFVTFFAGLAVGYYCPNQIAASIDAAKALKDKLTALYKG